MAPTQHYADKIQVATSDLTCTVSFGLQGGKELDIEIHMNPVVAKHLALLLRQQIKKRERGSGIELPMPPEVWEYLGIAPEDW